MSKKIQNKNQLPQSTTSKIEPQPFLEWKYRFNPQTAETELESIKLSDGSSLDEATIKTVLIQASGSPDPLIGEKILKNIAYGLSSDDHETRINKASAMLPALKPQDETEALLLGQFFALHDSGLRCLRNANSHEMFYHIDKLFTLATKLLNTANQTMQTLLKYRSGGKQTVQVIHVHNEGQAIVAQNLSAPPIKGGG